MPGRGECLRRDLPAVEPARSPRDATVAEAIDAGRFQPEQAQDLRCQIVKSAGFTRVRRHCGRVVHQISPLASISVYKSNYIMVALVFSAARQPSSLTGQPEAQRRS